MTCVEDVTRTSSPQQALLAIAKHIDLLAAKLDNLPDDDGWGEWTGPPLSMPELAEAQRTVNAARAQQVDAKHALDENRRREEASRIYEQLARATAPEEIETLNARLRLVLEDGAAMGEGYVPEGQRALVTSDGENGEVVLPPADEQLKAERYAWAMNNRLHEFLVGTELVNDPERTADAYSKGGPMWLYLGNREAVMQMPVAWRQQMVMDIERMSPATAHEVARDILKDESPGSPEITVETIERYSDA